MIEFIDKTSEQNGTPLNRANLMAIQGFEAVSVEVKENGSIVETNSDGHTLTTVFDDNGLTGTQTFVGDKTITLTVRLEKNKIVGELS